MTIFVTGSRAYGTPREDSDWDIVVMISAPAVKILSLASDETVGPYPNSTTLRFGKLNLICCTHQAVFDAWKKGTNKCIARSPITREDAVETLKPLHQQAAMQINGEHV